MSFMSSKFSFYEVKDHFEFSLIWHKINLEYDLSNGLFGTINLGNLTASQYGIIVVRDVDNSCTSTNPIINDGDLAVLLVNATECFSGIDKRDEVFGTIDPEYGISGVIDFTAPSAFSNTILDLQP